jgi:hypothetical protein
MGKTHTGEKRPRMGFFLFGKAHTGPLYGFLLSADIGQVIYYNMVFWISSKCGVLF